MQKRNILYTSMKTIISMRVYFDMPVREAKSSRIPNRTMETA